jgi:hypothetical protein
VEVDDVNLDRHELWGRRTWESQKKPWAIDASIPQKATGSVAWS